MKMKNVEIIAIGDELLIGQVVNTNAAWMGEQLRKWGYAVHHSSCVGDREQAIVEALALAFRRSDIILMTGGLGPTQDDKTKAALCRYFNTSLQLHQESLDHVVKLLGERGIAINEQNREQAMLPVGCEVLANRLGTAPILCFEQDDKLLVALPGVPYEMQAALEEQLLPKWQKRWQMPHIVHQTLWVGGIAESLLAERLEAFEAALPEGLQMAYLPSPGIVRLRLSGVLSAVVDEACVRGQVEKLRRQLGDHFIGLGDAAPAAFLAQDLGRRGLSLAVAESCTGGALAATITAEPGCSVYFKGGVVAYSNELKQDLLGVSEGLLEQYGAVSKPVVEAMAQGAQKLMHADVAMATSGIAGPEGATPDKPVGTVCIAIAYQDRLFSQQLCLGKNRGRNIQATLAHCWLALARMMR